MEPTRVGDERKSEEALSQVRARIQEWLGTGLLAPLELSQEHPWRQWFGWARDDPDRELYLEEIRRARQEDDMPASPENNDRTCSSISSTPTT